MTGLDAHPGQDSEAMGDPTIPLAVVYDDLHNAPFVWDQEKGRSPAPPLQTASD